MIRSLALCIVLATAGAAVAQEGMSLLDTRAAVRPPRPPVIPEPKGRDLFVVTALARVVGAELGPDEEAPLETRTALAAAVLALAREEADAFDGEVVRRLRAKYPRLCAQDYDGSDGLVKRDRAWMIANGYDLSVAAAQEAYLMKADPSGGAVLWSDILSWSERAARADRRTVRLPTSRGDVEFYRR